MRVPLRVRLRERPGLLATFVGIPATEVVEIGALAGFDAVVIDMEHGAQSVDSVRQGLLAAAARGVYGVVRVPSADAAVIQTVLDLGADGVLVPQVSSGAAAQDVVRATRYPPEGARGAHPWVRAADFDGGPHWYAAANAAVAVIAMVEGAAGLAALADIVAVPGLDAVFVGPVDLASSLGLSGQPEHPTVGREIERIVAAAGEAGLATGLFTVRPEAAAQWLDRGAALVALRTDTAVLYAAFRELATAVRAGQRGAGARG